MVCLHTSNEECKKATKKTTALQQHQKEYLKLKLKEVHDLKAETFQETLKKVDKQQNMSCSRSEELILLGCQYAPH